MQAWYCVRSVVTDGSGHSIVDTDVMPEDEFVNTLWNLSAMYNHVPVPGGVAGYERWTFEQRLSDGRRVTDMIIASKVG